MKKENERKESIINSLRKSLASSEKIVMSVMPEIPRPKLQEDTDPSVYFVERFIGNGGAIVYSTTEDEIQNNLKTILNYYSLSKVCCFSKTLTQFFNSLGYTEISYVDAAEYCDVGIIPCESVISEDAVALVVNEQKNFFMPKVMILFAFTSQVVFTWKEATVRMKAKYDKELPEQLILLDSKNITSEKVFMMLNED